MKFNKLNLVLFIAVLFLKAPALALDISEYGDFSSRSSIMNQRAIQAMPQEIKDLLKAKKITPTTECLIQQIKKNKIENVAILLKAKVNPNNNYFGEYPIYFAAKLNHFEIVKLLYENGAKIDKGFNSELYEAVKNKNSEMANYLLQKNAKVNYASTLKNETILYCALKNDMIDIVSKLIQKNVKIDYKSMQLLQKKKLSNLIENKEN